MYNKTIIRFSFSDILKNQGLGKCYVSQQMTCSSLEFSVAQWLEHLIMTTVWKVVGSIPISNSEFLLGSFLSNIFYVLLKPKLPE